MKQQNKWEKLFDEFLDLTEFTLVKHQNDWSVIDNQEGNVGDIESDRFTSAGQILDRMDIYIEDYIIEPLEQAFFASGPAHIEFDVYGDYFADILKHRNDLPDDYSGDFDILDMICNHSEEINLENCTYEEEC